MVRTLVLATGNVHKLREFAQILGQAGLAVDAPDPPVPVIEDGLTFAANAVKKAQALLAHSQQWSVADDSGLEVLALGGAPGVHSARFAPPGLDQDARNRHKLLWAMRHRKDREARFVCVIALCAPHAEPRLFEGIIAGTISHQAVGDGGFGYDAVFIPRGCSQTFAQMTPAQKNTMSHRALALQALTEALQQQTP